MKRLMLLVALVPLFLLVLSCGSKPAAAPPPEPAPVEQPAPPPPPPPAPPPPPPPAAPPQVMEKYSGDIILEGAKDYQVGQGDTLTRIAMNHYGRNNGYYFPLILMASRNTVNDPDKIEPGMALIVPDLERNLNDAGARQKVKEFLNEIADAYSSQSGKAWGKSTASDLKRLAATL